MNVLLTGASGQVGAALLRSAPGGVKVYSPQHAELDIAAPSHVHRILDSAKPELIINAAAYTAVDRAETQTQAAFAANADGPRILAEAAASAGIRLIHISTDFVFDGTASRAYPVDAATNPLSVYGQSKLAGEQAVLNTLGGAGLVLRTAWVYSAQGHNFVRTMLRLMRERQAVRVVADQIGTPTCADSIATTLWAFAARPELCGVHHWTDGGVASWYDFAVAIMEEGGARNLLPAAVEVEAIRTDEYPTAARRPAFSVLDKTATERVLGIRPRHWRTQLRSVLEELRG